MADEIKRGDLLLPTCGDPAISERHIVYVSKLGVTYDTSDGVRWVATYLQMQAWIEIARPILVRNGKPRHSGFDLIRQQEDA